MGQSESKQDSNAYSGAAHLPEGFVYLTEAPQSKSKAMNTQKTKAGAGAKVVSQQIDFSKKLTQIVPSLEAHEAQNCLKSGRLFHDPSFPASDKSLNTGPRHEDFDSLEFTNWKSLHDIYQQPVLFKNGTSAADVRQGRLGSCYLLAGLSALAQSPKRIQDVFLVKQVNAARYYSVKILYRGVWREIIVDDYIPMVMEKGSQDVAFTQGVDEEVWIMLLEKAWAKLYGSYSTVIGGYGDQSLHDFTGAPVQTVEVDKTTKTEDEMWEMLIQATQWNFPMVCSTEDETGEEFDKNGYMMGHVFTLLGVYDISIAGGEQKKLVKIRNPFGSDQQKGDWNDQDKCWKEVGEDDKERVGFVKDTEDGVFFCTYEDFLKHFVDFTIANVYDSFSYLSCTQSGGSKGYFEVILEKEGMFSFIVDQTPFRVFGGDYEYRETIILLADSNGILYIDGIQKNDKSVYVSHILTPGRYIVYANILEAGKKKTNNDVTLGCYCEFPCQIKPITKPLNFKTQLFTSHAETLPEDYEQQQGSTNDEIQPQLWVARRSLAGYKYFYINNQTQSTYRFKFTANKTNDQEGLILAEKIRNKDKWQCDVAPGATKMYVAGVSRATAQDFLEYEYDEN